jgi:hypothetical protein
MASSNEEIIEIIKRNPDLGRIRLQRLIYDQTGLEISEGKLKLLIKKTRGPGITTLEAKNRIKAGMSRAMTLGEFKNKYDYRTKILAALKALGDKVIEDADFRTEIGGINSQIWARLRESGEFDEFQIKIRDKIHWANPEILEEIRETFDYL